MNKGKDGKTIVVGSVVRLPHKEDPESFEDFVVVAVNRTAEKDDVRGVPVKALFACRALNAGQLLVLETGEETAKETKSQSADAGFSGERGGGKTGASNQSEVVKLRTDGPTLEKYVKAGYAKEGYPPKGYEAKDSPAYRELLKEREEAAKRLAESGEKKLAEAPAADQIPPA